MCSLCLLLLGPCAWEPGRGVPGCRGGLCPFCCWFVCVCFSRDFCRNGPVRCFTFSPAQWAPPQLNGPVQLLSFFWIRQLTDRAILANRQTQEKNEIEVTLLSGECKLLEVHRNTSPRQLRKTLLQAWSSPFITILGQGGDKLDFELPVAWQVSPVHGRISLQAMAQQPILTCNQNAAVIWCPNNPFLCALGSEYSGNCIDKTGSPCPRPIRQVFAGTHWFLAVKAVMTWGRRPLILRRKIPPKGSLHNVFSPTEDIVAFLWDEQQLDIWDDRRRAEYPAPLHSWSTVITVKTNEHAIAAILANGSVRAYGVPLGGGILPDLVSQSANKWPAIDLYAARYAFL